MPETELSILMPVYNEEGTVERAIERVLEADVGTDSYELVVVDDGSTDRTGELLEHREWPGQVRITHTGQNRGKGSAIRTALDQARGTFAVILDADLEYDPNDLRELLVPVRDRVADAAFGTRAFRAHSAYSFWYVMGNRFLSMATNVIFNTWITGRLLRAGARIHEVPITYVARRREEGKKIRPSDGLRGLMTLLRIRFT